MAKKKKSAKAKKRSSKRKNLKRKSAGKKRVTERKKSAAKKAKKKITRSRPKGPKLPAEPIGRVTHYFPHVKAAAVMIERDGLRTGDVLYFKGHTTNFKQTVGSLQIDRRPVPEASSGEEVGIQVRSRTREHDLVFKL